MSNYLPDEDEKINNNDESDTNPGPSARGSVTRGLGGELDDTNPKTKEKDSFVSFIRELPVLIITAVVIAFVIKWFIVQPFYIPSQSMEPTLIPEDRVLVSKFIYKFTSPKVGDIIVFIPPEPGENRDFIKRVVATEGNTVQVVDGILYINGKVAKQNYKTMPGDFDNWPSANISAKIPENHVFVMGDNRPNSYDGRKFGPVPEENIVGRAFMIYWPLNHMTILSD